MTWNLFTRILHWTVAIPVLLNFVLDGEDDPHRIAGYVALAAVCIRLAWGFFTSDQANFRHFPIKYNEVFLFLKKLLKREKDHFKGHNPLASWVYILMWIAVIGLGISGYLMGTDRFWGEEWLGKTHEAMAYVLDGLVILHFVGLTYDSIRFKRPTWRGMIDGKK